MFLSALLLLAAAPPSGTQEHRKEDTVRLISAQSAQLIEKDGESYRKVVGPARFLHNGTYLLCDTALWNVNTNIIDAIGHVRIIQDRTQLSSATLQYIVDENLAKFRGELVQLEDQDKNTLRTRYLDYNTQDSVAVFQDGAAMRDKDGQVIESLYGTYDAKAKLFVFNDQVNMYMDTTFVKTSRLEYRSDLSTATFGYGTDMWQDDKMLSANDGWYNRDQELFFFRRNVHLLTENQETWSDSLFYHRAVNDVEMLGHVELMDTTRNVYALAGRFLYTDSLSLVQMTREPAIMSISDEKGRVDTLYVGADSLAYQSIRRCDIPETWTAEADKRLKDISGDPVMEYRRKAAEEAAKAAADAEKEKAGKRPGNTPPQDRQAPPETPAEAPAEEAPAAEAPAPEPPAPPADTTVRPPLDTTALAQPLPTEEPAEVEAPADTVAAAPAVDTTVAPQVDTTKLGFIWASRRVRLFRRDIQMASDSLTYNDLDSLVRLYKKPIVYNEGNRQYAADSIYMVIRDQRAEKAHLLSNAFITIQEDTHSFDQIRGTEMVAYFDSTSTLTRFDALGGASSLFFLEEQDALATVNKVEAKMIYATFQNGDIERMYYYEEPKNDGYPSVQLPQEERTLKGFRWEPELRPASPLDVTSLVPRKSQRTSYLARPHADFKQTNTYFPGYIKKVYRDIAIRDSLRVAQDLAWQREQDSLTLLPRDSLLLEKADSLTAAVPADTLATSPADTLATPPARPEEDAVEAAQPEVRDPKAEKAAEKARRKAERQAALEAKWAEEDRIYAEKQAAKAQKKLDRERARKLKALRKLEKRARKERARFERYLRREREKASKHNKH